MPSLFRRKPANLVEDAIAAVEAEEASRPRGYTPSKKELGKETPKRPSTNPRAAGAKPLTKEEARTRQRELRADAAAEFRREGGPRDRGPERRLARDVVDSRRTVGTWFFGGALIVLIGSANAMPPVVRLVSNLLWVVLAIAVVVDSFLITRKIGRLVRERFPKTDQRMGSLYLYAIMRGITFRRMRTPAPQVKIGEAI